MVLRGQECGQILFREVHATEEGLEAVCASADGRRAIDKSLLVKIIVLWAVVRYALLAGKVSNEPIERTCPATVWGNEEGEA